MCVCEVCVCVCALFSDFMYFICDLFDDDRKKSHKLLVVIFGGRHVDVLLISVGFSETCVFSEMLF